MKRFSAAINQKEYFLGTMCLFDEHMEIVTEKDAQIAKLTEALNALEKEHRHQAECWANGEEYEGNGNALYHNKWADFCSEALKGSSPAP